MARYFESWFKEIFLLIYHDGNYFSSYNNVKWEKQFMINELLKIYPFFSLIEPILIIVHYSYFSCDHLDLYKIQFIYVFDIEFKMAWFEAFTLLCFSNLFLIPFIYNKIVWVIHQVFFKNSFHSNYTKLSNYLPALSIYLLDLTCRS